MRTLITGGFGFVGTHLTEELLAQDPNADIHIVDNLTTNVQPPDEFLASIGNPSNVTHEQSTVRDFLTTTDREFDRIYHLASVVGPAGVLPYAGKIAGSIITDAALVADAAGTLGARLVDVSTSEIYGGGNSKESDPKVITSEVSPRLEYAVGKLASEVALINQAKTTGLQAIIVRPFNIAGARQNPEGGFVMPRFCDAAIEGNDLTVFGKGTQVRAFTHVRDTATGIRLAMERGEYGEAYNIGNPDNAITIYALAQMVIEHAGSDSKITFVDPKEIYGKHYAEAKDKTPDADKAREELGWRPQFTIDDIIRDSLAWAKEQKQ